MARLRTGIIGAGFMGRVHARSARLAGAEVVGAAASSPGRADAAAAEIGAERGYPDGQTMIESGEVDVVHICTPNHLHEPLARAAVEAGLHVVCEKPLTVDGDEAVALTADADAAGVVATVPFVYRYHPMVREARHRVVIDDETGPLRLIHGHYLQDWMSRPDDYGWRVDPALGGPSRVFADIGSHWCDLMEFVSGHRIDALSATTAILVEQRRHAADRGSFDDEDNDGELVQVATEDAAAVTFRTDGGALGSLLVSQVSPGRKNQLRVSLDGTDAAVGFDQESPETLWIGGRSESRRIAREEAALSAPAARISPVPAGHPVGYLDCFAAFVEDTYAAVAGDKPHGLPTFADGARAAALTDAVLASAAHDGVWTAIE